MPRKKKTHEKVTPWLTEAEYQSAVGHLRLKIGAIIGSTYNMHGMDMYNVGVINAVVKLAEDFALQVRGAEQPIQIVYRAPNGDLVE